ncbi:hypothetical protein AB0M34_03925 [Nocardia sp. NPDC050193]
MLISRVLTDAWQGVRNLLSGRIEAAGAITAGKSRAAGSARARLAADTVEAEDVGIGRNISAPERENQPVATTGEAQEHRARPPNATALPNVARGRDLIDELDYHHLYSAGVAAGRHDSALAEIYRLQGFDGRPAEVGWELIDEIVYSDSGSGRLFRGVSSPAHVTKFKFGETHFPGTGDYGNGTYTTTDYDRALRYAGDREDQVMEMALRPGARTVSYHDLHAEQEKALNPIKSELTRLLGDATPDATTRRKELEEKLFILSDRGRFAAAKGYDAYEVDDGTVGRHEEWVILNRTALAIRQ